MSLIPDKNSDKNPPLDSAAEMEANRPLNSNEQHQQPPRQDSQKHLESSEQQNTSPQEGNQPSVKDLSGEGKKLDDQKLASQDKQSDKPKEGKKPTALVIVADGFEESEAVITVDMLRRSGVDVTLAGLNGTDAISGDNKIKIIPDKSLEEACKENFDCVIVPGGSGANKVAESSIAKKILHEAEERKAVIGAICGGPKALDEICQNCEITCYPLKEDVKQRCGKNHELCLDRVHIDCDGKLITSQAPGTAFEFANALIKQLCGEKVAHDTMHQMLVSNV